MYTRIHHTHVPTRTYKPSLRVVLVKLLFHILCTLKCTPSTLLLAPTSSGTCAVRVARTMPGRRGSANHVQWQCTTLLQYSYRWFHQRCCLVWEHLSPQHCITVQQNFCQFRMRLVRQKCIPPNTDEGNCWCWWFDGKTKSYKKESVTLHDCND